MATTDNALQTTGSGMTSWSSLGIGFYFQCAVVVIALVGTAANGLVLYALVASKQHRKHVLIFNQNVLDFVSCVFLCAAYAARLGNVRRSATSGYWLCAMALVDGCSWGPFVGSLINLAAITVERYLKVVARKKPRTWMILSAMALAWIGGVAVAEGATVPTLSVVNGVCYPLPLWKSPAAQTAFGIWFFVSFYVVILSIFVVCYWRIVVVIRRQAGVMAAHIVAGSSTAQTIQYKRIQFKIIKTMLLVRVCI